MPTLLIRIRGTGNSIIVLKCICADLLILNFIVNGRLTFSYWKPYILGSYDTVSSHTTKKNPGRDGFVTRS